MPTFEIQGADGASYELDAPDEGAAVAAFKKFSAAPKPAAAPAAQPYTDEFGSTVDVTPTNAETPTQRLGNLPGHVNDAVRGVADTATFGLADEFAALMGSATGVGGKRGDYEGNLAAQRKIDGEGGASRIAGQVAGGVALGGLTGLPRSVAGMAGYGAATGGLYGFGSGEGGAVERAKDAAIGAGIGGAVGGAAPLVGQAIGGAVRGVGSAMADRAAAQPGMGPAAVGKLAEDMRNTGGVGAARARMTELGPEAMLLDVSPSLEGRAQGLASRPETRQAVSDPLITRQSGANGRLAADIEQQIGPAMDPAAYHGALDEHYAQIVPPLYQRALSQPVQVDTSGVLAQIGDLAAAEKGGAANALHRAWGLLHHQADVPGIGPAMIPDRRPQALHNAKESLDAMIATVQNQQGSAAASELRALSIARRGVNDALEAQVPGYADANRTAQHIFQQRDAFNGGQALLNDGRAAARPAQLAADTAEMTPEVQQAQRLGLRAEVDRLTGTQLNDRVALRKALLGEGDYNRARMGIVFGEGPTAGLAGAVDREATFDRSHHRIVDNAMTELRRQSAESVGVRSVAPNADGSLITAAAVGGAPGGAAALTLKGGRMAMNAAGRASDIARNEELARILTMRQSPDLDRLLDSLDRRGSRQQIIDLLASGAARGVEGAAATQAGHVGDLRVGSDRQRLVDLLARR